MFFPILDCPREPYSSIWFRYDPFVDPFRIADVVILVSHQAVPRVLSSTAGIISGSVSVHILGCTFTTPILLVVQCITIIVPVPWQKSQV